MRQLLTFIVVLLYSTITIYSQQVFLLSDNELTGASKDSSAKADLSIYIPVIESDSLSSFPTVLICPGGGYGKVNMPYEGYAFAKWMQSQGFVAIVLKYRLPHGNPQIPFEDAQEALGVIKNNAERWHVNL